MTAGQNGTVATLLPVANLPRVAHHVPMGLPNILLLAAIQSQLSKETPPASWDNRNTKAMILRVRLRTPVHLEGYVTLEIALFRPMSYTQVWSRVVSTTVPIEGLAPEDGLLPGFDYTKTETPWYMHADHDSCWREGLDGALKRHEGDVLLFSGCDWYEMVDAVSLNLPESAAAWARQRKANVGTLGAETPASKRDTERKAWARLVEASRAIGGKGAKGASGGWLSRMMATEGAARAEYTAAREVLRGLGVDVDGLIAEAT